MNKKIPAIDVLRGIAALGVVWFHSRVDLWVGFRAIQANPENYSNLDRLLSWASLPASQMGSFVMLFFVLSGFCIHLPLAGKRRMIRPLSYLIRRGTRIYPAYLVTLLLCVVAAIALEQSLASPAPDVERYGLSLLLLQNWIGASQVAMNPSLWSIPVEVELYLVYPLLLWIHVRFGPKAALIFTFACTSVGCVLFFSGQSIAVGSFFKYAIIWNSGAWLAERFVLSSMPRWTIGHSFALLCSLMGTTILGLVGVEVFYLHYGWGLASFLGLWWLITDGSKWIPEGAAWTKALTALGTISYSVYLLHFPLFRIAGAIWIELFDDKPASFLVPCFATLAVIPFAWVFYCLVEQPSHQLGRSLSKRFG